MAESVLQDMDCQVLVVNLSHSVLPIRIPEVRLRSNMTISDLKVVVLVGGGGVYLCVFRCS